MSGPVKRNCRLSQTRIFVLNAGGILIPKELNQNIVQFLTGKDFLRFKMVSKTAEMAVKHFHALLYDAIHEQIGELLVELNIDQSRRQDQVNEHKFKAGNHVRIYGGGEVNGYCVRVTPKYVFYVPNIQRMGNDDGVAHVHPYDGDVVEVVQHWRTWASMTQEFLD